MWDRCRLCPSCKEGAIQKYVVPGAGNLEATTVFVGEGPGQQENSMHTPFVGKTGDEMDGTYLRLCNQDRDSAYFTNAFKCHWMDSSGTPSDEVIRSCAEFHLRKELAQIDPEVVVLMGGVAAGLAGLDVDMEHGFYHRGVELLGSKRNVFVTYHPALGMHKSSGMLALLQDFKDLKVLREVPVDAYPNPTFKLLVTAREVKAELGDFYDEDIAVDTESIKRWAGFRSTIRYTPWCATFSREAGKAFMVRVSDRGAWEEFGRQLQKYLRVIMHNSDHDVEILRVTGILLDWQRIQDTMQLAYHDGRLPRGLKALGYRLLGSRMRGFDEVVVPYGRDMAVEWVAEAVLEKWPAEVQEPTGEWEWKNCGECGGKGWITWRRKLTGMLGEAPSGKIKDPNRHIECGDCKAGKVHVEKHTRRHSIAQNLGGLVTSLRSAPDTTDIWGRWEGWSPAHITAMVERCGAIPVPSIDYVPLEEAIEYACSDAHNTLRIAPILRARVAELRRRIR